jgi:hypothetical protein
MEIQIIQNKIHEIRGQRVMLDFDLAEMYEVETRVLKQAIRRNLERFPFDFMFQLTKNEWVEVITNCDNLPENLKYIPNTPFAFTEQGVSMLSSVLRSKIAVQININIIRAFVLMRQHLSDYKELKEKIEKIETEMNVKFQDIYQAINYLMQKDHQGIEQKERKRIAFK